MINFCIFHKIQLQPNVCYALHDGDEIKLGDVVCSYQEKKQSKVDINRKNSFNLIKN
jgi:hypothetical protein